MSGARLIETISVAKPWGRDALPAPFTAPDGERIGEIWFDPPPELSEILVKYLFTSEKLSVQVHPSDAQAPAGQRGKEECWLVLDAEPDARLAIGFRDSLSAEDMRAAALDGSIEERLEWHAVARGDFFYLPAGTVHAIGAGLSILEIQQTSDITYRLFDYGRPRELHLDAGVAVAKGEPYPAELHRHVDLNADGPVVEGRFFRVDTVVDCAPAALAGKPALVLPLAGTVTAGGRTVAAGECALVEDAADVRLSGDARAVVVSAGRDAAA